MIHDGLRSDFAMQPGLSWPGGAGGNTGVSESGAESENGIRVSRGAVQVVKCEVP
jgi:hypothetical protein